MNNFKLSGDFSFDSHDIQSMDAFNVTFKIMFESLSKEQHVFIRSKLEEQLGLQAHSIPTAWGENPIRYEELSFRTKEKDFERCKTLVHLLKEGKGELTANGYRYPPDSDHPLFSAINPSEAMLAKVPTFTALENLIKTTLAEAQKQSPLVDQSMNKKNNFS